MAQIFNSCLRLVRQLRVMDSVAIETPSQILYKVPKAFSEAKFVRIAEDKEFYTIVCSKKTETDKIIPVCPSPLDAYRGRGKHSLRNRK